MKEKIRGFLKNNRLLYGTYFYIGSFFFKLLGVFIPTDNKAILFNSFAGKKYDDSTKAIYEYMIKEPKYKNYKFYWALDDLDTKIPGPATVIKNDSFHYFIVALKSKYWVSNSAIERGLKFKKRKTVYVNTWHGSAIKKMGIDIKKENYSFRHSQYSYMYAQSNYDIDVFSHAFKLPRDRFALVGLPRNDELVNPSKNKVKLIREKLGFPKDKKIILYAPTFRDYDKRDNKIAAKPVINIEKWRDALGDEYCLLIRAHYETINALDIEDDGFVYDCTSYNNLNELLIVADILISDYSSIMFDYSILERPIFAYTYDYERYKKERGLYLDIKKELPNGCIMTESELIKRIKGINLESQKKRTLLFKNKYVEKCGNASCYIDDIIAKENE